MSQPHKKLTAERAQQPNEKMTFAIECYVPGGTQNERIEWIQKFFDFFHPSISAKVVAASQPVAVAPVQPAETSMLD